MVINMNRLQYCLFFQALASGTKSRTGGISKATGLIMAVLLSFAELTVFAAENVVIQFKPVGSQGVIELRSTLNLPVSSMYGEYSILRSTNFQTWEQVADPISGGVGTSDELLRAIVPLAGDHAFYRVLAQVKLAPADSGLGNSIYGYNTEFSRQLQQVGQLSLDNFSAA